MPKFKHTLWKHTFHIDIFLIVRLFLFPIQLQPVIPSAIQLHEHICISFQIDKILHHKNRNGWEQATKIIKPNQRTSQICTDTRSEWGKKMLFVLNSCASFREKTTQKGSRETQSKSVFCSPVLCFKWNPTAFSPQRFIHLWVSFPASFLISFSFLNFLYFKIFLFFIS